MSSDGSGGGLLPDPGAANSPSSKSATAMSADDTVHSRALLSEPLDVHSYSSA